MRSTIASCTTTMEAIMPELFAYSFMVRALVAGALVAVAVPMLGSFLVARRYALISDSLAHVSLAGVGAGLLMGYAPIIVALPVAVAGALLLEWLRRAKRISGEVSLAILMSSGLALAVVFAGLARGTNVDFNSYLFGSITTTTTGDVLLLASVVAAIVAFIAWRYRQLLHIAFDEDSARVAGLPVTFLNYALVALTAVVVVLSLRIVGGLLMSALLVMPIVTASRFTRSFGATIGVAVLCALIAVTGGLVLAFYAGIAAGGAIVLTALALLLLALIWK